MRLAFLSTILHYPWGGADKLWTRAAAAAINRGDAVLLVISPAVAGHPRIKQLEARGAQIHCRSESSSYRGYRKRWREQIRSWRTGYAGPLGPLANFKPDHVFLCQGGTFDFLQEDQLLEWLADTNTAFTLTCQSNSETVRLDLTSRARAIATMRRARAIVFVSTHNQLLAERQLAVQLPHACVVHNPAELPGPISWPADHDAQFAVVARLESHDKGLDLLMPALEASLRHQPGWLVNVYGTGPDELYLRCLANRYDVGDRVRFHGYETDVASIWRRNQMLLLPSRHEGCSLAMLEALVAGRPVLATNVGGVSDWLLDAENAFICAAPTVELLAATMTRAWLARDRWPAMGTVAAATAARLDPHPELRLLDLSRREQDSLSATTKHATAHKV